MRTTAAEQLVFAIRAALAYMVNRAAGNALNGPNDDVHIARQLSRAIERVERERGDADALETQRILDIGLQAARALL